MVSFPNVESLTLDIGMEECQFLLVKITNGVYNDGRNLFTNILSMDFIKFLIKNY